MPAQTLTLHSIGAAVYRVPVREPVRTSFGVLRERAAVLVRVQDTDGVAGWGEIWCNFPTVGAEHRARLLAETAAPLALARGWASPAECHGELVRALRILAIQSGEPGPIAQVLAGLDIALWDLAARRKRQPLWRLLGGRAGRVAVYASGLNPTEPERLAAEKAAAGYRAFKLKVGFGTELDERNLDALRRELGDRTTLMADANQAWDLPQALDMAGRLGRFRLQWLEEPMRADAPMEDWRSLAARSPVTLAAGENLRQDGFDRFLAGGALGVLQPDLAKWGGFSGCMALAGPAAAAGAWLCPHWLGGGVGLLAALHFKAAVGGEGYAEVDANPNPLRELLAGALPAVREGAMDLPDTPGLGAVPDLRAAATFLVAEQTVDRTHLR